MLRTCGDYVEDMLIFAQCSINILSNHHKGTSTPMLDGEDMHLTVTFVRTLSDGEVDGKNLLRCDAGGKLSWVLDVEITS